MSNRFLDGYGFFLLLTFIFILICFVLLTYDLIRSIRLVREKAKKTADGLMKEINNSERHIFISSGNGEMIHFIYFILGRRTVGPMIFHLIWAEINIKVTSLEVCIYHHSNIGRDDDFLSQLVRELKGRRMNVVVIETNSQPDLSRVGVDSLRFHGC